MGKVQVGKRCSISNRLTSGRLFTEGVATIKKIRRIVTFNPSPVFLCDVEFDSEPGQICQRLVMPKNLVEEK